MLLLIIIQYNANIHRGVHALSQEATDKYEEARIKLQKHLKGQNSYEIIYSGTTHSINIIASGFSDLLMRVTKLSSCVRTSFKYCSGKCSANGLVLSLKSFL